MVSRCQLSRFHAVAPVLRNQINLYDTMLLHRLYYFRLYSAHCPISEGVGNCVVFYRIVHLFACVISTSALLLRRKTVRDQGCCQVKKCEVEDTHGEHERLHVTEVWGQSP